MSDPMIRQNPTGFLVTDSHRIPSGKSIKIYQMFQILRAVVLAILENTLFDASDPTDNPMGSVPTDSDIIPSPGILSDPI